MDVSRRDLLVGLGAGALSLAGCSSGSAGGDCNPDTTPIADVDYVEEPIHVGGTVVDAHYSRVFFYVEDDTGVAMIDPNGHEVAGTAKSRFDNESLEGSCVEVWGDAKQTTQDYDGEELDAYIYSVGTDLV